MRSRLYAKRGQEVRLLRLLIRRLNILIEVLLEDMKSQNPDDGAPEILDRLLDPLKIPSIPPPIRRREDSWIV